MTLPDAEVIDMLAADFVVGWTNIEREDHVGLSHGYSDRQTAVGTTNGAGGRNVQLLVLSADGVVLHALPGFWHPEDLVVELRFAKMVNRLWLDPERTRAQKEAMFVRLHEAALARQSPFTTARSDWQWFDRFAELERARKAPRDTMAGPGQETPMGRALLLKPLNVVMHERMQQQPFRPVDEFDVEAFVDYGRAFYDNNTGKDRGKTFRFAEKRAAQRAKEAERARAAEARKSRQRTDG